MRLQILVPHHDEELCVIEPLLDSLAMQQSVDFSEIGVVIAHDGKPGGLTLPPRRTERYPFRIELIDTGRHVGVSAARNAALDHATADYVMFCDYDDMLCNAIGLHVAWQEMEAGFDVLVSAFMEETRIGGSPLYVTHEVDSTFVHGKVYRRRFLADEGIRFCERLTVHEDSYFVTLAKELAGKARYCPIPWFLWKWRDASVCRHDPDYILKTYPQMLDSSDALAREFARRGRGDLARLSVGAMVLDAYYAMNKPEWLDKTNEAYRACVEGRFARYFADHRAEWESLSRAELMAASMGIRDRSVLEGMQMEEMTLGQWLGQIGGKDA